MLRTSNKNTPQGSTLCYNDDRGPPGVGQIFLEIKQGESYQEIVEGRVSLEFACNVFIFGCRMAIKLHNFHNHIVEFPEDPGDVSEERGQCFYQDERVM